jgi:EpsI family protein
MLKSVTGRVVIVAVFLLVTAAYLASSTKAETLPSRRPLATLPMQLAGANGKREADFTPDIMALLGVDDYITRTYFQPGQLPVGLYVGYYFTQRQGDTIHSPMNCLPGSGWVPLEQGHATLAVQPAPKAADRVPIEINRVIIGKGLDRQFVYYWYQSRNRVVASEYWGKIYTVLDAVRYNRSDAALVRVIVPIPPGADTAASEARATAFVQALFPLLADHIPT